MELQVDALVVGARVAGSITAALLGGARYRVLLVDRARFPSPTLSTHFFRGGRLCSVLDSLGVLDDVLALGSPKLICDYNYEGDDPAPDVTPPQDPGDIGFALSVRRETLDHLLIRRATAVPGVAFREGTAVTSLIRDGDRVVGATLAGGDVVSRASSSAPTVARRSSPAMLARPSRSVSRRREPCTTGTSLASRIPREPSPTGRSSPWSRTSSCMRSRATPAPRAWRCR